MRTLEQRMLRFFPALPMGLMVVLAVRCSSGPDPDTMSSAGRVEETLHVTNEVGGMADSARTVAKANAQNVMSSTSTATSAAEANTNYVPGNPAEERRWAAKDLGGMRTRLMAELALVRDRLNNGTQEAKAHETDLQRSADLAQGLERVDRALAAIGESTDATWADIRKHQLREVAEVHAWMRTNHVDNATAQVE